MASADRYAFEEYIDDEYMTETLVDLLQVDTAVPLGPDTLMEPDHEKLVHFVQDVFRPKLRAIGVHELIELPKNQLAVRMGSGDLDESLLLMAYTPAQHHNWMHDPFTGKIAIPNDSAIDEPCAFGQGAEQNKAHLAAMLTLLKAFVDADTDIDGTVYFAVNNEARSTHECSRSMLPKLDPTPDQGVLLIGGGNYIQVANRGRVDVLVHVEGQVTHSSEPEGGLNAIMGATEVINRIDAMEFTAEHPTLGRPHALPYQLVFDPVAPHTLPESARIKIDRRLLPGENVDAAVSDIRDAVGDMSPYEVTVERDVVMEPSVVDPDQPIVQGLQRSIRALDDEPAELYYAKGAFDAGGLTNRGIPTVMWGRPDRGETIMGDDYVTLRGVREEAQIIGRTVVDTLVNDS